MSSIMEKYTKIGRRARGLKTVEVEGRLLYQIPYEHFLVQFEFDGPFPAKVINKYTGESYCPLTKWNLKAICIITGFYDYRNKGTKEKCKRRLMKNR